MMKSVPSSKRKEGSAKEIVANMAPYAISSGFDFGDS
jgi:hypothetical protein